MESTHEELFQTALIQEREGFWLDAFRAVFLLRRLYPDDPRLAPLIERCEAKRLEEAQWSGGSLRPRLPWVPFPQDERWLPLAKKIQKSVPVEAHEDLALFFLGLGAPSAALYFLDIKHSVNLLYLQAWCLLELGQFEEARAVLSKPEASPMSQYLLARCLERQGLYREAREAYGLVGDHFDAPSRLQDLPEETR